MEMVYIILIPVLLISIIVAYAGIKSLYIGYFNRTYAGKYYFNEKTLQIEIIPYKKFFNYNMKINNIVTWKCPMNKAEENDRMKIKELYDASRVVVEHLNENNRISIEKITDLQIV